MGKFIFVCISLEFADGGGQAWRVAADGGAAAKISPKMKKILTLLVLPLALAGCSSSITNLTPSRLPRNSDNLYHLEAAWRTSEQAVRPESIKPMVMVGYETYEMRPEMVVSNRWETFVPVKADQNLLHYKFRFDFLRNKISAPQEDSKLSPDYSLEIVEQGATGK
jgi:hypothetical protein